MTRDSVGREPVRALRGSTVPALLGLVIASILGLQSAAAATTNAERLTLTARVWGLAKYRHPDVTACRRQWDQVLLDALPGIEAATDDVAFDQKIAGLLAAAGAIPGRTPDAQTPAWIAQTPLSAATKATLAAIAANHPASQCYVQPADQTLEADFSRDIAFNDAPLTRGIRLLGSFRFWNDAEYFFAYKDLIGKPWEDALKQHVLAIADAPDAVAYAIAMRKFTSELNDSHGFFYSPTIPEYFVPPFFAHFVENKVMVLATLPAATGVQVGDEVVAVNDEEIANALSRWDALSFGSNPTARRFNALQFALGADSSPHHYTLQRPDGTRYALTIRPSNAFHDALHYGPGPSWRTVPASAGRSCSGAVVNLGTVQENDIAPLLGSLRDVDLLVLDSRVYPDDYMAISQLLDAVLTQRPYPVAYWTPNYTDPGVYRPVTDDEMGTIGNAPIDFHGRIQVLVDEESLSQSEFWAMLFQAHPRTLVFGSQTAGADGEVVFAQLPGSQSTAFSSNRIRYRNGRQSQRVGIVPDVAVTPTIAGVRAGHDEVLDAALDCRWKTESPLPRRPRSGLYGTPVRMGEGVEIQKLGDTYAGYVYAYDDQGFPEWAMSTTRFESGVWNDGLLRFAPDGSHAAAGKLALDFQRGPYEMECAVADQSSVPGSGRAILKWPPQDDGKNLCVGPVVYGDTSPYSGLWAGAQGEVSWGLSLHHTGSVLVVFLYAYDGHGKPRWMGGSATWDGHGEVHVKIQRSKGVCHSCVAHPVEIEEAGEIVLSLPDATHGVHAGNWANVDVTFHDGHRLRRQRMPLNHL